MYVIDVIPISRGMGKETLSYFTPLEVELGSVVEVPLRKSQVTGIVTKIELVRDRKADIKLASFAYKKIDNLASKHFFDESFMAACVRTAEYHCSTVAAALDALIPGSILDQLKSLNVPTREGLSVTKPMLTNADLTKNETDDAAGSGNETSPEKEKAHEPRPKPRANITAIQTDIDDRYSTYKSIIRQAFAKKESVVVCGPTVEDVVRLHSQLSKGLEEYCHLMHGGTTKKSVVTIWNKIHTNEVSQHPSVLFTTPSFLVAMPRGTSTIILERENHRAYKMLRRPYLDFRTFAEHIAGATHINLIYGDMPLRVETLWRISAEEIRQADPFGWRSFSTAQGLLVDMKAADKAGGANGEAAAFKILSDEVKGLIVRTKEESEHMFIFAARRGVSPSTCCGDCHSIVTCSSCSSPVVLHESKSGTSAPYFLCHRCGERRSAEETCKVCGSWKLGTVGIGIDLVEKKIRDAFPDCALFRIDSDSTTTEKQARTVAAEFLAHPGSILLGTEMAMSYWWSKVAFSAVISLDSLFALPDFRIQEKVFSLITSIRARTTKNLVVQTRKPDEPALSQAISGGINHFYDPEIELRKAFDYPPFAVLIKLTLEGKREAIGKEMQEIRDYLMPYEIDIFPAFTHTVKGNSLLHGLVRILRDKWVDQELQKKLKSLPPSVTVKVDSESLL